MGAGTVDLPQAASILARLRADDAAAIDAAREALPALLGGGPAGTAAVRMLAIAARCTRGETQRDATAVVDAVLGAGGADRGPLARTLAAVLADPAALEPPVLVIPRLAWRGRVTLLAAREKGGKSTLAGAAAARVTRGETWLGEHTLAGDVLVIGLEEHVGDMASRYVEHGADPDRIHVIDSLAGETDPLGAVAREVSRIGPVLVVVDTLAALVDATGARPDPGSSTAWTPIMAALTRIARETDAAVLLLHHARKSDGAYRDSSAIGAGVDAILEMSEDGQDADVRRVRVRARWRVGDYSVRLSGTRYELSSGELSLDARVLLYIESHPGCSLRALRSGISGRGADVDAALTRLLDRGAVVDTGTAATGRRLSVSGDTPGNGVGTRSGTHPVSAENPQGHAPDTVSGHTVCPDPEPLGGESGHTPAPDPLTDLLDGTEGDV